MGTSMGGMHTGCGASCILIYGCADATGELPHANFGTQPAWRRTSIDAIRNDPAWNGGEYKAPPPGFALQRKSWSYQNPVLRQKEAPRGENG